MVLPSFLCVGDLVLVSAVSVARLAVVSPGVSQTLPEHLEDTVAGSHPSLGVEEQQRFAISCISWLMCFPLQGNQ